MSVGVIVEFNLKPGGAEKVRELFEGRLPTTRSWDGCESIYLGVDEDDPNRLFLVEKWASHDHYAKYRKWAMAQPGTDAIMPFMIGEMKTTYIDDTGV